LRTSEQDSALAIKAFRKYLKEALPLRRLFAFRSLGFELFSLRAKIVDLSEHLLKKRQPKLPRVLHA
jgi:hypothetical protein